MLVTARTCLRRWWNAGNGGMRRKKSAKCKLLKGGRFKIGSKQGAATKTLVMNAVYRGCNTTQLYKHGMYIYIYIGIISQVMK